ncbi:hypothetical protein CRENBAI_011856 [Crenichthys baileyi]|uniref:Secretory calcium-binding phosphoprotein 5 n=1 Tax=Crenichthys baileyi TaxID=28760 RepID=A0AAV9RFK5_9TELE
MKAAILCLCLAGTACALPFQYLPHFTGSRPRAPPTQVPLYGLGAGAAGTNQGQTFPQYGFIKYSIPQPPGRQSVEVFYPYDLSQNKMATFDVNVHPSQDPQQPLPQDQPVQTSQTLVQFPEGVNANQPLFDPTTGNIHIFELNKQGIMASISP